MALILSRGGAKEWLDNGGYFATYGLNDEAEGSYISGTPLATTAATYAYTLLFNPRTNNTGVSITGNGNVNLAYFVIKDGAVIDKGNYTGATYTFTVSQDCDFVLIRGNSTTSSHTYTVTITDN